jgi:hypothetical protein
VLIAPPPLAERWPPPPLTLSFAVYLRKWGPVVCKLRLFRKVIPMHQPVKTLCLATLLLSAPFTTANAGEREDVRKVINLVTSVKMPFPENLSRNRAKTERVWLDREGATTGCIRLDERRCKASLRRRFREQSDNRNTKR